MPHRSPSSRPGSLASPLPVLAALFALFALVAVAAPVALAPAAQADETAATEAADRGAGRPPLRSMSALAFGPGGVLFVGDAKAGAVYAIELPAAERRASNDPVGLADVESAIGALLGTDPDAVMVHDLAVHPATQDAYLSVSRGRGDWASIWLMPNDFADATLLLKVAPDGTLSEVDLSKARWTRAALPNPVAADKTHPWKEGISLRADTITDLAFEDGTLFVAGLSNEEFASTMWRLPYPFGDGTRSTTLEVFHGAHGVYETHAPIRTFVPYRLKGRPHLLAAYLCTPFATFDLERMADGAHVRGRTVAEFGSGNYPVDMLVYRKDGKEKLLIANSNLPFLIVDPADVESFEGALDRKAEGYTAGIRFEFRSGSGIQQMDLLNPEYVVALQRLPSGRMALVSLPVGRF